METIVCTTVEVEPAQKLMVVDDIRVVEQSSTPLDLQLLGPTAESSDFGLVNSAAGQLAIQAPRRHPS